MADLRHLLAIYVHAHQTGNSVPPHIDADARAALAAEPPAPGPTINDIWELCEDHEFHLGDGFDDDESAESMLQIINTALSRWGNQPPAPVPVPVSERPQERQSWCDMQGRCWLAGLPHWAIPQPPQGGEVVQ